MATLPKAIVTLLTSPTYLPGALVLLHSLQELHPAPRNFKIVCLVTPETVDARTIGALRAAGYDLVIGVEPIASGHSGQAGLELMGRPDLNLALTKLHLFRLGSVFSTIIYLDADTLPLRPLEGLFDLTDGYRFSASPDIGWPDCFNSGVMVIRPQSSDFDNLRTMMTANSDSNGSFDGADQGLLNQYFAEDGPGEQWNRLPFTYNVTPSAAYQYAPAYKHYAYKINLIHFIGPNKPWSNLSYRAASQNQPDKSAFDYNSLVDRWYDVYDRHVRPTAVHEPNLAKRFTVPGHVAVWNQVDQTAPPQDDRLNLVELKAAVEQGVTSFQPGQYTSLPLDGRVDLIAPPPVPKVDVSHVAYPAGPSAPHGHHSASGSHDTAASRDGGQSTDHHDNGHHSQAHSHDHHQGSNNDHQPHHEQQAPHHHHEQRSESVKQPSPPPQDTWDASRYAPPKQSRPEMAIPMKAVYSPAWDEPVNAQRSYFQTQPKAADTYPSLPSNVQNSDWYRHFTATTPDQYSVQSVFPWEQTRSTEPSRTFPKDEKKFPLPPPPKPPVAKPSTATTLNAQRPPKVSTPPPPLTIAVPSSSAPRPQPPSLAEAMASYTNAWDDVASIGRYAKGLTAVGIGADRRSTSGIATLHSPHPHRRHSPHAATSDNTKDSSTEVETSNYPGNALYHDNSSQTDRPRLSDAKVQASPEFSPPQSPTDKQLKVTLPTQGASANKLPTYSFASGTTTTAPPKRTAGRVWDPKTDVQVMRNDTRDMLSKFSW